MVTRSVSEGHAGLLGKANGHLSFWWTEGSPDEWSIVQLFHGYEDDPLEIVPVPITQFLIDFVSNKYPNMLGGNPRTEADRRFSTGIPGRNLGDD